ncbi:MAG: hypothetical protein ABIK23_01165 [candidate division WOR-3 bacterium]
MRTLTVIAVANIAFAIVWPIPPVNQVHPLGNNWGEFQDYGGGAYFHNGIDIITPDTSNVPVLSVSHGWVKAWGTIQAGLHYRIAVCDSPLTFTGRAEGWLYAHIDTGLPHKSIGDEVWEGDTIGYLVPWPVDSSFDHLHFARISDTGATWQRFPNPTWWFIQNPLCLLEPNTDTVPPVFENARLNWRFAFCRNNQNNRYLHPDSLVGDVDIIARVYDKTGFTTGSTIWDRLAPYQLEYMIRRSDGLIVVPWTVSVQFSNILIGSLVNVVYKDDNTCNSRGDYSRREYYFILTNTDGDSIIEATDSLGKWATGLVGDGEYWVIVRASDVFGNYAVESMPVHTCNGVGIDQISKTNLQERFELAPTLGRGECRISFTVNEPGAVEVMVFDASGRMVKSLFSGWLESGLHTLSFSPLTAGVYNIELKAGNCRWWKRAVFIP